MDLTTGLAIIIIVLVVAAVVKGIDVRLVLLLAALSLGVVAGEVAPILREFFATFSNEKFVIPICTAMGFAYVLKHTECDSHMVRVLVAPIRRVRFLLIPGVILAGFVVNIPVISQTSTAVCLGTVVVPLMRAAGFSALSIGSVLLLGASVGGELLNPGAPELNTVRDKVGGDTRDLIPAILPLVLPLLFVSTVVMWILTTRAEWRNPTVGGESQNPAPSVNLDGAINPLKALVPVVPLVLLFVTGPPFKLFAIPPEWVVPLDALGKVDPKFSSRLIGLAMLIGVAVAALVAPRQAKGCMKAFFDGAGYGFANIISLIVTANCFGKGIEQVGLAKHLGDVIAAYPGLLHPLAGFVPALFAWVSGSGMASTQSLYGFFHAPTMAMNGDPVAVGALVSVGSAVGRTMSPVAAVVLMCANLTGTKPLDLVKRVGPPLLIGLTTTVVLRVLGLV